MVQSKIHVLNEGSQAFKTAHNAQSQNLRDYALYVIYR